MSRWQRKGTFAGLMALLLFAATATALGVWMGFGQSAFSDDEFLRLSVRVHVMSSAESEVLNCSRSRQNIAELFEGANQYWEQAGIRWEIESVRRREARSAQGFDALFDFHAESKPQQEALRRTMRANLEAAMPQGGWLSPGLDVVLVEDFGAYGAGFYDGKGRVYLAHRGTLRPGVIDEIPPVIFAHELGHALELNHVSCNKKGNLMLGRCKSRDLTARDLDASQIRLARARAAIGVQRQQAALRQQTPRQPRHPSSTMGH